MKSLLIHNRKIPSSFVVVLMLAWVVGACGSGAEEEEAANATGGEPEANASAEPQADASAESEANASDGDGCGDGQGEERLITWSSTSTSSANYTWAVQTASVISEELDDVQVTVIDSTGAPENLVRHRDGQAQLSHMTTDAAYLAARGEGAYSDTEYDGMRVMTQIFMNPLYFAVRADSGIENMSELSGEGFSPGFAGSATTLLAQATLEALDIEPDYYMADLGDAVDATRDGRIVGFVKAGANPDANLLELSSRTPINLVGLSDEEAETVRQDVPFAPVVTMEIPAGTYNGIDEDLNYTSTGLGLFIGIDESVPQEVGYCMVKAVWENWSEGVGSQEGFADYNSPEAAIEYATVPLHAGSVQYFRELGLDVPDELVPSEYTEVK